MVRASYCHTPEMTEQDARRYRRINYTIAVIAQVVAAAVGTLLTINVSSMNSMMTKINGDLNTKKQDKNAGEIFYITDTEASRYATISVVTNLFGSILSGVYQDVFGRRNCLLVSTLPQITSWFILYYSKNAYWLYSHAVVMGIGSAFCEHVFVTYISEIASVEMRGRLFSVGKFGYGTGVYIFFKLTKWYHWRKLALGLSILPMILPLYLFWLPESPVWLLTQKRDEECRRSLMWLRGWIFNEHIENEYQNLLAQLKQRKAATKENAKYKISTYTTLFTKPEFLEPFKISLALLFSSCLLSLRPIKLHFINFLDEAFGIENKDDKNDIMSSTGSSGVVGCVLLVLTIRKCGKRALTLWTFSVSAIFVFLFALFSILHTTYNFTNVWIIYVLCFATNCLGGYTLGGMPWFIISEIFPQKYRGFCSGVTGMVGHLMNSTLTGTYMSMKNVMGLTKLLLLYGTMGIICIFYLYKYLPETENKSLHDIEEYFKKTNKHTAEDDGSQSVCVKLCNVDLVSSESKNEDIPETV